MSAKVFLSSTNLLKFSKYLQMEKSSINYKQSSLSLISIFSKELEGHLSPNFTVVTTEK